MTGRLHRFQPALSLSLQVLAYQTGLGFYVKIGDGGPWIISAVNTDRSIINVPAASNR